MVLKAFVASLLVISPIGLSAQSQGSDGDAVESQSEESEGDTVESSTEEAGGEADLQDGDADSRLSESRGPSFVVSNSSPRVGEIIEISAEDGATVVHPLGHDSSARVRVAFLSFGQKELLVMGPESAAEGTEPTSITIPVVGKFRPVFDASELQHDTEWTPVTTAKVRGHGEYDEVALFRDGQTLYTVPIQESYEIPFPIVGRHAFELSLFHKGAEVSDRVRIALTGLNSPPSRPKYEGAAILQATVGDDISFQIEATDPNGDPLTFEARPLPEGATLDQSGIFRWVPTATQTGLHLISFYVSDSFGTRDGFVQRTIVVSP